MDISKNITFLDRTRHLLNPLHIYCRLTCLGVSSKVAMDICKIYEAGIYKPTLGRCEMAPVQEPTSMLLPNPGFAGIERSARRSTKKEI